METLEVRNFLSLSNLKIEVRPFTVLIGPQAQGKSIIARLIYLFRDSVFLGLTGTLSQADPSKQKLEEAIRVRFLQFFPRYAFDEREFEVIYRRSSFEIRISHSPRKKTVDVDVNDALARLLVAALHSTVVQADEPDEIADYRFGHGRQIASELILKGLEVDDRVLSAGYITESRTYVLALRDSFFDFLSSSRSDRRVQASQLTLEFGALFQSAMRQFPAMVAQMGAGGRENILRTLEHIVDGTVEVTGTGSQGWIVHGDRRVLWEDASSGQQDTIPMLLVLALICDESFNETRTPWWICIEEPESHLFPTAQGKLVELFATLRNSYGHRFLVETHSPYILTALNNLIAAETVAKEDRRNEPRVDSLVPKQVRLPVSDVGAYLINSGTAMSIMDPDTGLINAELLDTASEQIAATFHQLMEIALGHKG